jgi:hypothetical protein
MIKALILLMLISCKNSNDSKNEEKQNSVKVTETGIKSELIGKWKYSYQTQNNIYVEEIDLKEDGEFISVKYTVFSLGTLSSKEYDFLGRYKDGMIDLENEKFGSIKYSEKQKALYFKGNVFEKEIEKELLNDTKSETSKQPHSNTSKSNENPVLTRFKITEDNLRLRALPSLDADKITNLPAGTMVKYLNEKSEQKVEVEINNETIINYWYKVQTDSGEIGWIHGCCFEQQ